MSKSKRNHFIPRVLLRRFRVSSGVKKPKIWMFRKTSNPIQTSIDNVAVGSFFYGQDGSLEALLSQHESSYERLFEYAHSTAKCREHQAEISRMVWALAVRTRSLRNQFSDVASRLLDQFESKDNKDMLQDHYQLQLDDIFESEFESIIDKLPKEIRVALLDNPEYLQMLKDTALKQAREADFAGTVSSLISQIRGSEKWKRASESGQVRGLTQLLNAKPPAQFGTVTWEMVNPGELHVILGDCAVLTAGPDGKLAPALLHNTTWRQIFLPISPHSVLVGTREKPNRKITIEELNQASVECSVDYFFSSQNTSMEASLLPQLGTRSSLFTDEELRGFVQKINLRPG